MARIEERPDLAKAFIDSAHQRFSGRPHAPEAHSAGVTSLITCLRKTWARRNGLIDGTTDSDEFKLTVTVGSAYHALLPPVGDEYKERHVRLTVPGVGQVTCYIDWLDPLIPGDTDPLLQLTIPAELKTTRQSAAKPPSGIYVEQVAGEVLMHSQGTRGRLYVLYLAGNYRPPFPQMKVFEFDFADEDLDDWAEELGRRLALAIGTEEPPITEHANWMCRNCPRKEVDPSDPAYCPGGGGEWDADGWFAERLKSLPGGFDDLTVQIQELHREV